jgi:hypothetical protein
MMPDEWPTAAPAAERSPHAHAAGRGRLATVRLDFFLDPGERLTEQERALMTAMLHCLIGDIAADIRSALPEGSTGANDDDVAIVELLTRSGLLDDGGLMALLLRRADEERIGTAARARSGRREARALQGLVSHQSGAVSAAAMALMLARGRRRDRFGQCVISFDDLRSDVAEWLVHAVAAALRRQMGGGPAPAGADGELSVAAADLLAKHDPSRSIETLTDALVSLLADVDGIHDDFLLACAQEGEVVFLAEALGRRCGVAGSVAFDELLSAKPNRVVALFRLAGLSRELSAGLFAIIGDLLGIADPGAAIGVFDRMRDDEIKAAASWLMATPAYRAALEAIGSTNG